MSSKFDRSAYEPKLIEVTIGALLSVLIGVVLAGVWLITKPIEKVREIPAEPVAGTVYYIEGTANGSSSREWMVKVQQFVAGQSLTLTEGDLNTAYRAKAAEAEQAKKDEPKAEPGMLNAGQLNFRIADSELQIGAPVDVSVLGFQTKIQVFAQGVFERSGSTFAYAPTRFYIGSLRVDKLPVVGGMLMHKLLAAANLSDDVTGAWGKLGDVKIEGNQLQLIMP